MHIRVLHAKLTRPGCDFPRGSRSAGFWFFPLALAITLAMPWRATGQNVATATPRVLPIGSVTSESFILKDVAKPVTVKSIVVVPAGAVILHVSGPMMPDGTVKVSTLFRKPGRVTIRLPLESIRGDKAGKIDPVRTYDIIPWPMTVESMGRVIRAGVGGLAATMIAGDENAEVGSRVRIDLTFAGTAAMMVENPPDLVIHAADDLTASDSLPMPILVDSTIEWGDGAGGSLQRSWTYEWRSLSPGAFRVEPLRVVHLDSAGKIQTRLVTGPRIHVRPRALFHAGGRGQIGSEQNGSERLAFVIRITLAILTILGSFMLAGLLRRFLRSRWLLKRRIRSALRHAGTQEQFLDVCRKFAPEWSRYAGDADSELQKYYEEMNRRAFGQDHLKPTSVETGSTNVR